MSVSSRFVRTVGPFGLYTLAKWLNRNQPRILMYHRFSKTPKAGFSSSEEFRWQVEYIKRHCQPMTLRQLTERVYEQGTVPQNAVVITIDDGYHDFYEIAFPILREFGVPATLFVATGFIDEQLWLWPDQVKWVLWGAEQIPETFSLDGVVVESQSLDELKRNQLWDKVVQHLLSVPDARKHELIAELSSRLNVTIPEKPPEAYSACQWSELRELVENGIEIGGHTVTHPTLGKVDDDQATKEIEGCWRDLNKQLGHAPYSFCYPNGKPADFTENVKGIVEKTGFGAAVTAFADAQGVDDRYAMRRHTGTDNRFQFMKSVSGLELLGRKLRRRH